MEDRQTYEIKDICLGIYEGPHATPKVAKTGGIYLGIPALTSTGHINYDNIRYISDEDMPIWTKRVTPQEGDIVFTNEATLNLYAVIPPHFYCCLGRRLGLIRPNKDLVDVNYLFYYFFSPEWRETISKNKVSGATVERILMTKFPHFPISLPSLSTQHKISKILSTIDSKIENNRKINDNLEQQAKALYKSWFVDFEPFKEGDFVESELGLIPEGWKVAELSSVTKQITEKVKDRTDVKVLSPVNTGELVLSEEYFTKQVFSESVSKYIVVKPLQFAYNPARVNIGSLGMNTFSFDGCVSPVYVVFECESNYHHFFDYYRKTEGFKEEVLTRAIGGVRQTLSYKDFSLIKLVYPPHEVVEEFNSIYEKLLDNINRIKSENTKLLDLRDTLLPKLMSGELKINEIDC